ncbi:TGOLN2 [Branchiostoma lanceolatum]|uniref:TGOLN2 protein n=1 Tax=Branchiostoma lanceolatum TaxID=7740 RepID=A0A8K0EFF3_BRALA|nr:TGOLN2 [Branchiostoma lanceolatum]
MLPSRRLEYSRQLKMASTGSCRTQFPSKLPKMKLFLVLLVFCTSSCHGFSVERTQRQRREKFTVGEVAFQEWTAKNCMFPSTEFRKVFLDACDSVYEVETDMPPITPICELFHKQSVSLCNEPVQLQLGASTTEDLCHSFSKLRDEIGKERKKYLGLFLLSEDEDMCQRVCDEKHLPVCDGVLQLLQNRETHILPENVHQSRNLFADTEAEETEAGHSPQEDPQEDNPQQDEAGSLPKDEADQDAETGGKEETAQDAERGGSLLKDDTDQDTGGSLQEDQTGGDAPQEETVQEAEKDADNPGEEGNEEETDKNPDDAAEDKDQEEEEKAAETDDDDAKGEELTVDGGPGGIEEEQSVEKRGPDPEEDKPEEETGAGEGAAINPETGKQPIEDASKTVLGGEAAIGQETGGQPVGDASKTGLGGEAAIGQETVGQPVGDASKTGLGGEADIGQETGGQPIEDASKTGLGGEADIGQETGGQPIEDASKTGLGGEAAVGQETGGQPIGDDSKTGLGGEAAVGQETGGQLVGDASKTGLGGEAAIGQEIGGQPIGDASETGLGGEAAIGQEAGGQPIGDASNTGLGGEAAIGQEEGEEAIEEAGKAGLEEGAAIGLDAGEEAIEEAGKAGLGEEADIGQETGGQAIKEAVNTDQETEETDNTGNEFEEVAGDTDQQDTGPENQVPPPNFEEGEGDDDGAYPDEEMVDGGDKGDGELDGDYGNDENEDYNNRGIIEDEHDDTFINHDDGDTIAGGGGDWPGDGGHPHGNDQAQLKEELGAQANIYDLEEEPKQGHFMAYFVTFCVLIVLGYVTYHNRQKVIAIIIEGRAGLRDRKSRRPSGGGYKRLDQNVPVQPHKHAL